MPSRIIERTLHPEIQYATLAQQSETAELGMWVFIATEVMFFGALIFGYFLYRFSYPAAFAEAGKDAVLWCGTVNLALLMTSSLTMVLALHAASEGQQRALMGWLAATALLGLIFIGIKGYEYVSDYEDQVVPAIRFMLKPHEAPAGELFWFFYFVATGIHAIHLSIGIGCVLHMMRKAARHELSPAYHAPLEVVGLYWSFVDTVWIFLYPAIYLVGRT